MKIKMTVLAMGCALALAACSNQSAPPAATSEAPAPTTAPAAQPAPPAEATAPAAAPAAAPTMGADGKATATVVDCATQIEGSDAMQFNVSSIVVPASCKDFKITLKHSGTMPVSVMGHDVVIAKEADMKAVDASGIAAGLAAGYVKADDPMVIAHTSLIGGGETTSVSFPVSKIQGTGPYEFFCTFPGHSSVMKGSISVQ